MKRNVSRRFQKKETKMIWNPDLEDNINMRKMRKREIRENKKTDTILV